MRKYLVAAVVAVMVFAFAAFAATLQVNSSALQSGMDMDLTCADWAEVTNWGLNDHTNPPTVAYAYVTLNPDHTCEGEMMHFIVLNSAGGELARGNSVDGPNAPAPLLDAQTVYRFTLPLPNVELIEGVRVSIDQGF